MVLVAIVVLVAICGNTHLKCVTWESFFRIRDILIRIRIPGSVPLGYWSESCCFFPWLSNDKKYHICLLLSVGSRHIYINLQIQRKQVIKKSQNSWNPFFLIFCLWNGRIWTWIRINNYESGFLRIRNSEHKPDDQLFQSTLNLFSPDHQVNRCSQLFPCPQPHQRSHGPPLHHQPTCSAFKLKNKIKNSFADQILIWNLGLGI